MNTTPRIEISCWHCQQQFSRPLPQQTIAHWTTSCPYCGTECTVDFKPYPETKSLFKQTNSEMMLQAPPNLNQIIRSDKPPRKK